MAEQGIEIVFSAVTDGLKKGVADAVAGIKEVEKTASEVSRKGADSFTGFGETVARTVGDGSRSAVGALVGLINPANLATTAVASLGAAIVAYATSGADKIETLSEVLNRHKDTIKRVGLAYPEAIEGLDQFAKESNNILQTRLQNDLNVLSDRLQSLSQEFIGSFTQVFPTIDELTGKVQETGDSFTMVADKFRPFRSAIEQFIASIQSGSPNVDQFKNNVSDLAAQFRDDASIQKFAVELLKIAESADTVSVKLQQTQAAISRLSDEASGAAAATRTLATTLKALEAISPTKVDDYTKAQTTLNDALKDQNLTVDQRNKLIAAGEAAMKRAADAEAARKKPAAAAPEEEGITAQMERRMQFIRDSTLTEEGLLIARYERNRLLAQEYFALEMADSALQGEERAALKAQQDATIEALDAKHQQNLQRMRAATDALMINNLASTFGNIGSIIESSGKRGTAAAKAMYIAQALMSTFSAATQAMANPLLIDPVSKFAAYAAVATKGLAAVASIAKVGGGGGGGAAAGASAASAGASGGSTGGGGMGNSVYVNLQGQTFGRDQVRSLVEQIAQYQKDGGQVVFA